MQTHLNHSFNIPIIRNACIYKTFIGSVMLNIPSDTSMNIRVWIRDRRYSYRVPLWRELFITCFWVHRYLSCIPCRQFTFFRTKRSSQYLIRLYIDVCCYKVMSLILNIYLDLQLSLYNSWFCFLWYFYFLSNLISFTNLELLIKIHLN